MGTHRRGMLELAPVREDRVIVGGYAMGIEPHAVVDSVMVVTLGDIEGRWNVVCAEVWFVRVRDRWIGERRQDEGRRREGALSRLLAHWNAKHSTALGSPWKSLRLTES